MIKYVINHKKVRGSLITLTSKILKDKIFFLKDPMRKPSEYLYCMRSQVKEGKNYAKDKTEFDFQDDKNNKLVKVSLDQIKSRRFKLSEIGREISDSDL